MLLLIRLTRSAESGHLSACFFSIVQDFANALLARLHCTYLFRKYEHFRKATGHRSSSSLMLSVFNLFSFLEEKTWFTAKNHSWVFLTRDCSQKKRGDHGNAYILIQSKGPTNSLWKPFLRFGFLRSFAWICLRNLLKRYISKKGTRNPQKADLTIGKNKHHSLVRPVTRLFGFGGEEVSLRNWWT